MSCIFTVWYYFGVVGSFVFIIIQLILLIDFAHSWNQSWLERAENGNRKCWFGGRGSATHTATAPRDTKKRDICSKVQT